MKVLYDYQTFSQQVGGVPRCFCELAKHFILNPMSRENQILPKGCVLYMAWMKRNGLHISPKDVSG